MGLLRVIFMGTAEFSCPSLRRLAADSRLQVLAVVTQPDRPKGRDLQLTPSPVKALALELNLPVLQPAKARDPQFIAELAALQPDLIIVVAYGQILPAAILDLPRHGCLNIHGSLLPKYRGAAPVQWAVANGESETGVCIMQLDPGLDTGPVLAVATTPIAPEDDAGTLLHRLAELGAELLLRTIPSWVAGEIKPQPQPAEGATYAAKIRKEDGLVDWQLPAEVLERRLRAFQPWPGLYSFLMPASGRPMLVKFWKARVEEASGEPGQILSFDRSGLVIACGRGALRILELQREGGRRQTAEQSLAGAVVLFSPGTRLGNPPAA